MNPPNQPIFLEGSPFARGLTQGKALRASIHGAFGALASLPLGPDWVPAAARRTAVRATLTTLGHFYWRCHGRLLASRFGGANKAFVEGLAEGAGMAPPALYGLSALEIESGNLGFSMGCTSLGLAAKHTAAGEPRLAYNHDFPPVFEQFLVVRRSKPESSWRCEPLWRSLSVTYPSMVGAICGVNERGLAASLNQAYATDIVRSRPATFVATMMQDCLDRCSSVLEATALLTEARASNGMMVTLVDAGGDRAVVELSGGRACIRRAPEDDILYTFNKYRVPEMEEAEVPVGAVTTGLFAGYDVHECNLTRERRLLELDHGEAYDERALLELMADHDGGCGSQNTICRHDDPLNETILTAIIDPVGRSIRLLFGKPCRATLDSYTLT